VVAEVGSNPAARLPGPRRIPILGWRARGLSMLRDPTAYMVRQYERFGEISAWEPNNPKHVFAFGPDYLRRIFAEPDRFISDAFREVKMPKDSSFHRLTNGLTRLNGPLHRQHRQLVQQAFLARRVLLYTDAINELAAELFDGWRVGQTYRLDKELSRLIMQIAIRTIFDITDLGDIAKLRALVDRLLATAASPTTLMLPYDLPGTSFRTALRTSQEIEAMLLEMIRSKRPVADERIDVLSTMIAARDENGAMLSDHELISEAYTSFCHDSSTSALVWTLLLLDQHPSVMDDLVAELGSVLGGAPVTADTLDRLPLLDAVVKEVLRLLPPAPFLLRYTAEPTMLGPYQLDKDATIFFSPYVTHRLPELYENPLKFDPGRWDEKDRSVYEYTSFGAGPHYCIGRHFALLEIKLILAMLLQRFRPVLVPGTTVNRTVRISLLPSDGLPMTMHEVGARTALTPVQGNIRESVQFS
jgi:cytochrome P450